MHREHRVYCFKNFFTAETRKRRV